MSRDFYPYNRNMLTRHMRKFRNAFRWSGRDKLYTGHPKGFDLNVLDKYLDAF